MYIDPWLISLCNRRWADILFFQFYIHWFDCKVDDAFGNKQPQIPHYFVIFLPFKPAVRVQKPPNLQKRGYCKCYSCLCASGTCPSANLTLVRKQNKYKKRRLQPGTAEPGHWRFSRQTPHRGGEGEGRGGRIKRTGSESHFNRPHTIWAPTELSLPDRFLFIPYQCLPTASFLSFTLWGSSLTISQQLTPWNSLKGKRKGSKLNQSCLNNTTEEINS